MLRKLMAGLLFACSGSAVLAADAAPKPLPSLALDPDPSPSIWHGLWVGADVVAVAGKGTKGFVGGDVTAGYDRVFANNVILGVNIASGVAPGFSFLGPVRAYDFATAGMKVAYPMGRWTPYVATDLVLAKPNGHFGGSFSATDSVNALFNDPDRLDVGGRVGAGFDYALTSQTSVGLGVSVGRGAASVFP